MKCLRELIGIVALVTSSSPSSAVIRVERICDVQGQPGTTAVQIGTAVSGDAIVLDIDAINTTYGACKATYRFRADNVSMESVGHITLTGTAGDWVRDVIVAPADAFGVNLDANFNTAACVDWGGLTPGPFIVNTQAKITGAITGAVRAARVARLSAGSTTAAGDITHDGPARILQIVVNGAIAGDIVATTGNIDEVQANLGEISGHIRADAGRVLRVFAGDPDTTPFVGTALSGNVTSGGGTITLIQARNITGTISATAKDTAPGENWAILDLIAVEDIGVFSTSPVAPVTPATITTFAGPGSTSGDFPSNYENGGIRRIQARNIYANVTTPRPTAGRPYSSTNSRGDIRQIITTGSSPHGMLAGTIETFTLGDTRLATGVRSMQLGGNLVGEVLLKGTIKNPVLISGGIAASGKLALTDQDLISSGDITIVGALAGLIEIDGSGFGDLTVNPGSMPGTIKVMGDLGSTSHLRVGGPVSGNVEIGQNLLGQLSLTGTGAANALSGKVKVFGNMCSTSATVCAIATIAGPVTATGRFEVDGSVFVPATGGDPGFDIINFTAQQPMAGTVRIGRNLFGRIITAPPSAGGMPGQIVVNAENSTWVFGGNARVRVGQTNQTGWQNIAAANYASPLSGAIGGGAVGVGRYELHEEDCIPPYDPTPDAVLLTSSFLASPPSGAPAGLVRVRSYGPMKVHADYTPGTAVRVEVQNPLDCEQWYPAGQFFTVTLFPGGNKRVIELTRVAQSVPYAAVYRVVPEGLVCEEIANEPQVNWPTDYYGAGTNMPEGAYVFRIGPDCGGPTYDPVLGSPPNGIVDGVDVVGNAAASPPIPPCSACDQNSNFILDWCEMTPATICACDWNLSGVVSVQDLFDFLACYFAGDGDINNSGSTTVQDIFDFLNCFFVKPPPCL